MKLQAFPYDLSTTGMSELVIPELWSCIWGFLKEHNTAKIIKVAFKVIRDDTLSVYA